MKRWLLIALLAFLSTGLQAQRSGKRALVKDVRQHSMVGQQHLPLNQNISQDIRFPWKFRQTIPEKIEPLKDPSPLNDSIYEFVWDTVASAWKSKASGRWLNSFDKEGRKTKEIFSKTDKSGTWRNINRTSFLFNASGDETVRLYDDWDSLKNDWNIVERDTMVYNAKHQVTSEKWYYYNPVKKTWFLGQYYSYNDSGYELDYYTFYWDPITYELTEGDRLTSTPNANDKPLTDIRQNYNAATKTWENTEQTVYVYTQDTLLSTQTISDWTGSAWQNNYRTTHTYIGTSGHEFQQIDEYWDVAVSAWIVEARTTFSYQQDLLSTELQETWNQNLQLWANYQRNTYTYQNNLLSLELQENWDDATLAWVNYTRTSYFYYPDNQTKEILMQVWTTGWEDGSRTLYNSGGQPTEYWSKYPFYVRILYTYDQNNSLVSATLQEWNSVAASWRNQLMDIYYYSILTGITNPNMQAALCEFINPYLPGSVIRCSSLNPGGIYELSLYNMAGSCIHKQQISGNAFSINISLPEGLYLITITSGKELIYLQKIVMQNQR